MWHQRGVDGAGMSGKSSFAPAAGGRGGSGLRGGGEWGVGEDERAELLCTCHSVGCQLNHMTRCLLTRAAAPAAAAVRPAQSWSVAAAPLGLAVACQTKPDDSYEANRYLLTCSAAPAACCCALCAGLASGVSAPADPNLPEGIPLDAADSSKVSIQHKENRQGVSCTCAWVEQSVSF